MTETAEMSSVDRGCPGFCQAPYDPMQNFRVLAGITQRLGQFCGHHALYLTDVGAHASGGAQQVAQDVGSLLHDVFVGQEGGGHRVKEGEPLRMPERVWIGEAHTHLLGMRRSNLLCGQEMTPSCAECVPIG